MEAHRPGKPFPAFPQGAKLSFRKFSRPRMPVETSLHRFYMTAGLWGYVG